MSLSKIVQESVDSTMKEFDGVPWPEHQWLMLIQAKGMAKKSLISSQISLLEAELERKKGMMKKILHCLRGSENACVSCESGFTNCEYAEQDRSYNQAIQEDITYLTEQIELIKKMV